MKNYRIVAVFLLMIMVLLSLCSAALAIGDFYQLSEVAASWDGTHADRTKTPTTEYDYTYGDEEDLSYTLPWTFPYFGHGFNQINVDTNGSIWFTSTIPSHSFNLANTGSGPVIAAWNNNLSSYYYGGVFIQRKTNPERVVVEWQSETYLDEGYFRPNTFEVVLFPNGTIRMDYKIFNTSKNKDFGSGISWDNGTDYSSLSAAYGNIPSLGGRSFQYSVTSLPAVVIDRIISPASANSLTISGSMIGTSLSVSVDTGATPGPIGYSPDSTWSCTISNLAEGVNNVTVTASDQGGKQATSSVAYVVDTVPPTVTINSPKGTVDTMTPLLDYFVSDGEIVVKVDGKPVPQRSGDNLLPQMDGPHVLTVEATDLAKNKQIVDMPFIVDTQVPYSRALKLSDLKMSASYHTLKIRSDGTLWGWGENSDGTLGDDTSDLRYSPIKVGMGAQWANVAAGGDHTAAIQLDGTLWTWGWNYFGQLGDGTSAIKYSPVQVRNDITWTDVAAGENHTVAINATDGSLWAWGYNGYGQLGDGSEDNKNIPTLIDAQSRWVSVAARGYKTAAIKSDGTLWAWGDFIFTPPPSEVVVLIDKHYPIKIGLDNDWKSVSTGGDHIVALKADGSLWAWGDNSYGQLGDGSTSNKEFPVRIGTDNDKWTAVSAGSTFTVAVKTDGTLWAWGDNTSGALGDGTTVERHSPVQIGGDSNWVAVTAGAWHVTALKTDRTLWAWGGNGSGQVGDGTDINRLSPVQILNDPIPPQQIQVVINDGAAATSSPSVQLRINGSANNGVVGMQFSNDNLTWSNAEPYTGVKNWSLSEGEGTKTVYARFFDVAGNAFGVTSSSIVLSLPPVVTIASPKPGITGNNRPMLSFSATKGSVVTSLDGAQISTVSGATLGPLSDGPHTVLVQATSDVGFTGADSVTFTVDSLPPSVTVNPVATPTREVSQVLSGSVEVGAIVTVTASTSASVGAVSYITPGTWTCTVTSLTAGINIFTVTATDQAGNGNSVPVTISYQPPMSVNLTPANIDGDYKGTVVMNISNLATPGSEVLVEQLVDANRNGLIDQGDYVVRSFKLTDGTAAIHPNIQGDEDGAVNGSVVSSFDYTLLNDLYHAPGKYLLRVTQGADVATAALLVGSVSQMQTISGIITDGTNAVPGTMVLLQDKWQRPVAWGIADDSGAYVMTVKQPGEYRLLPVAYGYSAIATTITVSAGQNIVNWGLTLVPGTHRVFGHVKDSADGRGIGGVWVSANGTDVSHPNSTAMTGMDGSYSFSLPAGQYSIAAAADPTIPNPCSKGYLVFNKQSIAANVVADVILPDITLPLAEIQVSGRVQSGDGTVQSGIPVQGKVLGSVDVREPVAFGMTKPDGSYTLAITPGNNWNVSLQDPSSQALGFIGTTIGNISTSTDTLTGKDLTIYPITAWVQGTVTDSNANAVAGGDIRLRNADSSVLSTMTTVADGTYRIGTFAGNWLIDDITHNKGSQILEQAVTLLDAQSVTANFVVDVTPPTLTINPVITPTASNSQTITGTVEAGSTISVAVDTTAMVGVVAYPTPTTWSCSISGLVEGSNLITVTANDPAGNSIFSTAQISVTSLLPLGAPASLIVPASNSTGNIYVYWSASNIGGSTYTLEYSKDGGAWTSAYSGTATGSYVAATADGSYSFRVKASKTGYADSAYTVAGNTCTVALACGAPASIFVPTSNSTGSIYVYWSASNIGGSTYTLEYSKDGGSWTTAYNGTAPGSYVAAAVNGSYAFRVKAAKAGYADSGYTVAGNTCTVALACGAPASIVVPASNSTGSIYVYWSSSNIGGSTYTLEYSKDGGSWTAAYNGTATGSYVAATADGSYAFRVKAAKTGYADSGYTVAGNTCTVALACGAPASIVVPASNSTGSIYVYWSSSNIGGSTYTLEYSKDGGSWTAAYNGTATGSYVAATADGSYAFRVKAAKTGYADSGYTIAGNTCTVALTCGAPASIVVPASNSTGSIYVYWSLSNIGGSTYTLEYSKDGGTWITAYSGTGTGSYVAATANGSYAFRVKASKTGYADSVYTVAGNTCTVALACGAPASLVVPASNSTGSIYVYWSSSNIGGSTYTLEYSKDGGAWTTAYSGTATGSYVAATADGSYSFRVKASKTGYADSSYTIAGNTCTVALTCGAPASIVVPASNSTGSIYVYWSPSNIGGSTYTLEYSKDGGAWTTAYNGTGTGSYVAATADGSYAFRVKASKTGYADSGYTVAGNTCMVALTCGAPASLVVPASNSTGSIYVYWSSSNIGGSTYTLEYSKDGGAWTIAYSGTATGSYVAAAGNGSYSFRVKAAKTGYADSSYTVAGTSCVVTLN